MDLIRDPSGTARAYVRVTGHTPGGSFVKVVTGPTGYIIVPVTEPARRYMAGYVEETCVAGEKVWVIVGGRIGPVRLNAEVSAGDYLSFHEGHLRNRSTPPYVEQGEFGVAVSDWGEGRFNVVLFPEVVVEQ
jgi:hypothetical protein